MRNIRRDLTYLPTISLYEPHRCDTSHLNARLKLPFLTPRPPPSSSNLRNPLSPPDDIYFPEYIHHENVYLCILPLARRSVIHTYILLPHVTPAGFRRTYRCPVYVRKRCFIMRAERSRHIFPVYVPPVCCIPFTTEETDPL